MVGGSKREEPTSQQYRRCEGEWSNGVEDVFRREEDGMEYKIKIIIPWNGHRINDGYREHRSSATERVTTKQKINQEKRQDTRVYYLQRTL